MISVAVVSLVVAMGKALELALQIVELRSRDLGNCRRG
jgi:hypothetical protein